MAKASGAKSGIAGALKAGGLRAMLGLAVTASQNENRAMLGAMVSRLAHIVPFLGDALARGKSNKNAVSNLMEIAKTMEVIFRAHQISRARLRREANERLELKTPEPPMASTKPVAPQARRPVRAPQHVPVLAPKPTFSE